MEQKNTKSILHPSPKLPETKALPQELTSPMLIKADAKDGPYLIVFNADSSIDFAKALPEVFSQIPNDLKISFYCKKRFFTEVIFPVLKTMQNYHNRSMAVTYIPDNTTDMQALRNGELTCYQVKQNGIFREITKLTSGYTSPESINFNKDEPERKLQ